MQATKLTVWAPATPGAMETVVGTADTIAEARLIARRYEHRRDLHRQDVTIRRMDGKLVERCGPVR